MDLAALTTKTRYFLDDDSAVRWGEPEVTSYINEAYRFYYNELIAHSYDGITKTASLALVADTETVTLPTDLMKTRIIYRVESNYDYPLEYVRNYDRSVYKSGAGASSYKPSYDYKGSTTGVNELVLYPRPTFSDATGLKIIYWPTMTELSNTTDVPIAGFNANWHDMIPLRAALWAKGGREEEDVSNLSQMLTSSEKSFYDTITRMSNARASVEPFNTGD